MKNSTLMRIASTIVEANARQYGEENTNWQADMANLQDIWNSACWADKFQAVRLSWNHFSDRRGPGHPNLLVRFLTEDI